MAKTISFALNENGIERAMREINAYRQEVARKADVLRLRIGEAIAEQSQQGFATSGVDDRLQEGMRPADVSVTVNDNGNVTVVLAEGADAVWVEFGAGVYHNGPTGSSPNPLGSAHGYTIGSYGKGYGKKNVWGYYDGGRLVLTHGTPATMPMYRAIQAVCSSYERIAKEVFDT